MSKDIKVILVIRDWIIKDQLLSICYNKAKIVVWMNIIKTS